MTYYAGDFQNATGFTTPGPDRKCVYFHIDYGRRTQLPMHESKLRELIQRCLEDEREGCPGKEAILWYVEKLRTDRMKMYLLDPVYDDAGTYAYLDGMLTSEGAPTSYFYQLKIPLLRN
ncbi:hypothetical protein SCHPADRAFT_699465 [Schizopora paradoxa]|uniref:Uncharacterized protein n=1 Tax=Schizopora paradoxa TaxID=27342 RepID=A0A0H2R2U7_9AGAM|nr:hypothetical protein SCHPADRAFT_699465 [Schizopora paradoxa]